MEGFSYFIVRSAYLRSNVSAFRLENNRHSSFRYGDLFVINGQRGNFKWVVAARFCKTLRRVRVGCAFCIVISIVVVFRRINSYHVRVAIFAFKRNGFFVVVGLIVSTS